MEDETKSQTANLPESPASVNTRLKSPNGFIYQWTMRDEKNSNLFFKIREMEKKWLAEGFTPVEQTSGFPKREAKPIEYVEGRVCPKCGNKLVHATKKDGTKFVKCSTNKFINGQATGCPFVDWGNKPQDESEASWGDVYINKNY